MNSLRNHVIFIWGLAVLTLVVTITGLIMVESPLISSGVRNDEFRVKHSQEIIKNIETYHTSNSALPKSLTNVEGVTYIDPSTKKEYFYRVISPNTYELCMDFETEQGEVSFDFDGPSDPFAIHKQGRVCANVTVESDQNVSGKSSQYQSPFLNMKADMHINSLGEKTAIFDFQHDQENQYYTVDVSTDDFFQKNIYLRFAQGSSAPLTTSSIDYYDFTCGTTLYWRVTTDKQVQSEIYPAVVTCDN